MKTPSLSSGLACREPLRDGEAPKRACLVGFTLVEVAMSLGIFAFAIIPIIGMISTGLNVSKDSIDASTMSQIFRISEAYASTNTDASLVGTNLYFTSYAERLTNSAAGAAAAVYQVNFATNSPNDAAQGLMARRLLTVSIVKAAATTVTNSARFFQLSRDPVDLKSCFP